MLGQRESATSVRRRIEQAISHGDEVVVNFDGISATQSFVDELVGALILRAGPSVLDHLAFRNCTADVKAIVKFVAADRADQYLKCSTARHVVKTCPKQSDLSDRGTSVFGGLIHGSKNGW